MKILIYIVLLLSMSGLHASGFKYYKEYRTYWSSVGYSNFNMANSSIDYGRGGAALGMGYSWKQESDLFYDVGAELSYLSSTQVKLVELIGQRNMIDNDLPSAYNDFLMTTTFDDLKEWNDVIYLSIAPSVAYGFYSGTYVKLGAKVSYALKSSSYRSAKVSNYASYPAFVGEMSDMPDHFLIKGKRLDEHSPVTMGINVSATFELGGQLRLKYDNEDNMLRLGVFVDYGLLNVNKSVALNTDLYSYQENPANFKLNSELTIGPQTPKLHPLYVGVRLSYYFCTRKICSCMRTQGMM